MFSGGSAAATHRKWQGTSAQGRGGASCDLKGYALIPFWTQTPLPLPSPVPERHIEEGWPRSSSSHASSPAVVLLHNPPVTPRGWGGGWRRVFGHRLVGQAMTTWVHPSFPNRAARCVAQVVVFSPFHNFGYKVIQLKKEKKIKWRKRRWRRVWGGGGASRDDTSGHHSLFFFSWSMTGERKAERGVRSKRLHHKRRYNTACFL